LLLPDVVLRARLVLRAGRRELLCSGPDLLCARPDVLRSGPELLWRSRRSGW
jgi:hypothetical protein